MSNMEASPHPPPTVPSVNFGSQQDCVEYGTNRFQGSGFWTSIRRQYVIMAVVNLVTFLQGASLSTASITVPRLSADENFALNDTTWPKDFVVTEEEGDWICKRILQIRPYSNSLIALLFCSSNVGALAPRFCLGGKLRCGDYRTKEVHDHRLRRLSSRICNLCHRAECRHPVRGEGVHGLPSYKHGEIDQIPQSLTELPT